MPATDSTVPASPGKPAKPAKPQSDFPLFPHASGRWAKKIRGKLHYFGKWDNPEAALTKYLNEKDALHAGKKPRLPADTITVKDAVNEFLAHKEALLDAGELSPLTWANYKCATDELIAHMGKTRLVVDLDAQDFAGLRDRMAKKWGVHRLTVTIQHIRSVFKYAFDADLIQRPIRFGPGFKRPTKKTIRLHKAEQGPRLFTADEVRRLIAAAGTPMKAIILLGINCGLGNSDCGNLPLSAVSLDTGWLDYPRPKTGISRRCPLWPETVQAMREALSGRHEPKRPEDAGLFFITKYGQAWAKDVSDSPVTKETKKLLKALDINGHRNFYTLRHTFRTIADEAKDQPAADFIMGHAKEDMAATYRETISDGRLKAVSDHVRGWLFPEPKKDQAEATDQLTEATKE